MGALDRPFLISADADPLLSFGQLEAWSETIACFLKRNGVVSGDIVVAELPNSPAFAAVLRGTWNVGAVFVPLDPDLSARDRQEALALVGPRVVVARTVTPMGLPTLLWRDPFEPPTEIEWIPSPCAHSVPVTSVPPAGNSDRLVLFTSGSTGKPKAVALTETNVAAGIAAVADHFALTPDDRTIALLPWSQGHGLFACLLATEQAGCAVVLPTAIGVNPLHMLLNSARPTWLTTVPSQLAVLTAMLQASRKKRHGMRFLRTASVGLTLPLVERAERLLGCPIAEALDLAETGHQAAADPPSWDRVPGTVGTPTGSEFRLVGEEIAGGRELEVRGAAVFSRYLGNPAATAAAFTADGWFRTRDVARQDAGGQLRIRGHLSEIVHRGEHTIAPVEVESVLGDHPDVVSSLATRVPHPDLIDDLVAVIELRKGSRATKRDIVTHCRAHLADHQVPGQIRMVERLPRLPNGKPSRRMAAKLFEAR